MDWHRRETVSPVYPFQWLGDRRYPRGGYDPEAHAMNSVIGPNGSCESNGVATDRKLATISERVGFVDGLSHPLNPDRWHGKLAG